MVLLMFQHIFVRHALTHYVTVMSGDSAGYDANTPCIPQHAAVFVAQCLTVLDVSSLLRLRYATCRRHDDVICKRKPQWRQIQQYTLPSIAAQTRSHVPDDAHICTDFFDWSALAFRGRICEKLGIIWRFRGGQVVTTAVLFRATQYIYVVHHVVVLRVSRWPLQWHASGSLGMFLARIAG